MSAKQRKIAVMGSRSVGKSSLALQFVQVYRLYGLQVYRLWGSDLLASQVWLYSLYSFYMIGVTGIQVTGSRYTRVQVYRS